MFLDLTLREWALAALLLACDLGGLLLGARFLRAGRGRNAGVLPEFGRWLLFGATWAIVWGWATAFAFASKFAVLRVLTHVAVFVLAPLSLGRGLSWIRCGRRHAAILPLTVGLVVLAVYLWAFLVEPRWIEVSWHRVDTPKALALEEPVRIAVLADIQTDAVGGYEEEVFRSVAAAAPDLVILPGDFVQTFAPRFGEQREKFRALFDLLRPWPKHGVYAVLGDIDPDPTLFEGTKVQRIDDRVTVVGPAPGVQLIGRSLRRSREPLDATDVGRIEAHDGYTIVVGHAPDYMITVVESGSGPEALFLAGHTHGGQIVVPGFGPPMTLTSVSRDVAGGGLHAFGDARVCVSRGVGMERGFAPRVRLFCRPEVVMFELGKAR
ncbi:MAG: metallophosphoesterase, partial [Planctomycetota bacterium]